MTVPVCASGISHQRITLGGLRVDWRRVAVTRVGFVDKDEAVHVLQPTGAWRCCCSTVNGARCCCFTVNSAFLSFAGADIDVSFNETTSASDMADMVRVELHGDWLEQISCLLPSTPSEAALAHAGV